MADEDPGSRSALRRRVADALRRISTAVVGRPVDLADLAALAEQAESLADAVDLVAGSGKAPRVRGGPGESVFLVTSPMIGPENPVAPPASLWRVEGADGTPELRGRVRFGYAYEGPPTCVHGGALAELFDEMLGASLVVAGRPGMTGTLTVRYRRPTPLQADLDLVARPTTVEGRKRGAWGAVFHHGELTAEADGVFIAVDPAAAAGIMRQNMAKAGVEVVDGRLLQVMEEGGAVFTDG